MAFNDATHLFTKTDRFGSIAVYQNGQIIIAEFHGPCSCILTKHYAKGLLDVVGNFGGKPWAYLNVSENFEAATDDAIEVLVESFQQCILAGCTADAYVVNSILVKQQVDKVRRRFPTKYSFDQILFADADQAQRFLLAELAKR